MLCIRVSIFVLSGITYLSDKFSELNMKHSRSQNLKIKTESQNTCKTHSKFS